MPKVILVDENSNIVGAKEKKDILPNERFCATALWLSNNRNEILLAKRSLQEKRDPGCWGPAVHGIVEENETSLQTIARESQEEIGLDIDVKNITEGPRLRMQGTENEYFLQWFFYTSLCAVCDFSLDEKEVSQVIWISKEKLLHDYKEKKRQFVFSTSQWIDTICK